MVNEISELKLFKGATFSIISGKSQEDAIVGYQISQSFTLNETMMCIFATSFSPAIHKETQFSKDA